jgi:hypothetical protein
MSFFGPLILILAPVVIVGGVVYLVVQLVKGPPGD